MSDEWVEVVGTKPVVGHPLVLSSSGENLGIITAVNLISGYANMFDVSLDTESTASMCSLSMTS